MLKYHKLQDDLTELFARSFHYFENFDKVAHLKTAAEVTEAIDGGIKRYMVDPVYAAKVNHMVAHVTLVVQENENAASQAQRCRR
jgi:pentose-5-phosphate-3-epimerase